MTPKQIDLVQSSWALVLPIRDTAASLFYGRLFELDPGLQALFRADMREQGRKLVAMIGMAVANLARVDGLKPKLHELSRKHVDYGVRNGDYDIVGAALVWTLEQVLGAAFTVDIRSAWVQTYALLADVMKKAAADEVTYGFTD